MQHIIVHLYNCTVCVITNSGKINSDKNFPILLNIENIPSHIILFFLKILKFNFTFIFEKFCFSDIKLNYFNEKILKKLK